MSDTELSTPPGEIAAALDREVSGRIVTAADAEWDVERSDGIYMSTNARSPSCT